MVDEQNGNIFQVEIAKMRNSSSILMGKSSLQQESWDILTLLLISRLLNSISLEQMDVLEGEMYRIVPH